MIANSAVLDCLERAGSIGVHIDDLTKYLGFEEKKHILPRLYDLQARGFVDRVPGQKWKIVKSDLANSGMSILLFIICIYNLILARIAFK